MHDDLIAGFTLDGAPVRGRIARLGQGALDPILRRHAYPRPAALLLGEAIALAALLGSLLKADARLIIQAQGDGPIPLLVAEHGPGGALRGYARIGHGAPALAEANRIAPRALIGAGSLAITLDQGGDRPLYQGVAALDGDTLGACAEAYFHASVQTPTRIRLAVGELIAGAAPPCWRAGGVLIQRIAPDHTRGDVEEDWARASALFDTVQDQELVDPGLGADRLLYRLFHEDGVRMSEPGSLNDLCTCDEARLTAVMRQFPAEQVADLVEPDGLLHARCQFCARDYRIAPEALR